MERDQLLDLIKQEQAKSGYVSEAGMAGIAQSLGIPLGKYTEQPPFTPFCPPNLRAGM